MAELNLHINSNFDEIYGKLKGLEKETFITKLEITGSKSVEKLFAEMNRLKSSAQETAASLNKMANGTKEANGVNKQTKAIKSLRDQILDTQKKIYKAQESYDKIFHGRNKDRVIETDFDTKQLADLKSYEKRLDGLLTKARSGTYTDADVKAFESIKEQANTAIKEVNAAKAKIEKSLSSVKNSDMEIAAFDKIGNRLTDYFKRYETGIRRNSDLYNQWLTLMNKANNRDFASISEANRMFAEFRTAARQAGVEVEGFGSKLAKTFGTRIRSALSGYGVFALEGAARDILKNTVAVDTALTELKKVTNETDVTYAQFLEGAEGRAQRIGASLSEVVNATADYARLGYNIDQATTLADSALVYENVGDDVANIDDATSALISTMQGFGIAAEDSMGIVDKFNNVSNNFASSAGDIGEIVKRSAASMSAAGNSLDQTNNIVRVYRNMHHSTYLKPVKPKALSLQYMDETGLYECNENKTTIGIPYGQNPKWRYNGSLVAKSRIEMCQKTIRYRSKIASRWLFEKVCS